MAGNGRISFEQMHVEDTFHNDKNVDKKYSGLDVVSIATFKKLKYKALYSPMSPDRLNEVFDEMRKSVHGHVAITNWINRIQGGKEKRCATYTTKHFICSSKGATSQYGSAMTKMKSGGTMKKEMRHW